MASNSGLSLAPSSRPACGVLTIDTTSSARSRFLILHHSNPHFSGGCEQWFTIRVLQSQPPARRRSESLLRRAFGPTLFQATGLCTAPTLSLPIPNINITITPPRAEQCTNKNRLKWVTPSPPRATASRPPAGGCERAVSCRVESGVRAPCCAPSRGAR
jgi:hypothetical protein